MAPSHPPPNAYMDLTDDPIDINFGISHRAVGEAVERFKPARSV